MPREQPPSTILHTPIPPGPAYQPQDRFLHTKRHSECGPCARATLLGNGRVVVILASIVLGFLLVVFAVLRENSAFWTNAGGYPAWLKDLVLWAYLPLLLGTLGLLSTLSADCFSKIGEGLRFFLIESLLILLGWGMLTMSCWISFHDNMCDPISKSPFLHHFSSR
jgi:hypothetical protein